MAATFNWCEDNGTATGSPSAGTTRTGFSGAPYATDVNWKSVDDCTNNSGTAYNSAPITVPPTSNAYSMPKYQYGVFGGTFTQISGGLWSASTAISATVPTGISLKGEVSSTYVTPAATDFAFANDYSTVKPVVGSGETVNFSETGPEDASPASTLSNPGYTQYLTTQMVVASTCTTAGDTPTWTTTLRYSEN